jgi:ATP-dependent exoDNAse (exonuclease V) beta subunit
VAPSGDLPDAVIDTLRGALEVLARPDDAQAWAHLLSAPPLGFAALRARFALARFRPTTLEAWLQALEAEDVHGHLSAVDFGATLRDAQCAWIENDLPGTIRRLVRGLRLLTAESAPETIARVRAFLDTARDAQRVLAELGAPASCSDVLESMRRHHAQLEIGTPTEAESRGVQLLTVHGAKGLQFDAVVIGDAVEGRFPVEARPSSLLRDEDRAALRAADVEMTCESADAQSEEASLWYVALTRTRSRLVITYAREDASGVAQRPSRFIPRELLDDGPPFERSPERLEFATLRLGDPAQLAALATRVADSPVLRTLVAEGAAAFAAPPPQPTLMRHASVSVSALVQWLHCPRSFYYHHILGLADESSLSASIGKVLHGVLEAFHARFRDFRVVHAEDLAVWRDALRALCTAPFEGGTAAERAAAARFLTRAIESYAEHLWKAARALPFVVESCETPVRITFASGALKGKIDRVDRFTDGTLGLRDYKSGRMKTAFAKKLSKTVAADDPLGGRLAHEVNPQLALYDAAFSEAVVSHLSYWYFKGEAEERDRIAVDDVVVDTAFRGTLDALLARVEREFFAAFRAGVESPLAGTADAATCRYCPYARICPQVKESW